MATNQPTESPDSQPEPDTRPENTPWYSEGLRFECTACGDCCSGAPGFVWVEEKEIAALAEHLGMAVDEFQGRYVRQIGPDRSLVEYPDGDCIFLDRQSRKCSVYAARPNQCRTWPFWDSNLATRKGWKRTCEVCPGSGRGQLYSFEEIEIRRKSRPV